MKYNHGLESVLRGYKNGKYVKFYINDKISVQAKDKTKTGIITSIGTKYLYIQTGSQMLYSPRMCGRCSEMPIKKIELKDVIKIAKYPEDSQRFKAVKLGGSHKK